MKTSLGPLPAGLAEFLAANDGAEGFVGESYLALWQVDRIADLNALLEVSAFAPDLLVFATDGGEAAYAVDQASNGPTIVNTPLVGLGHVPASPIADDLNGFLLKLGGSAFDTAAPSARKGLMRWMKTPILLGGQPTEPSNEAFVPLDAALKMAAWWNHRLADLGVPRDIARR